MTGQIIAILFIVAVTATADTTLEALTGVTTTAHKKSPYTDRTLQALQAGIEPTAKDSQQILNTYRHNWTVLFPDLHNSENEAANRQLTVKIWERNRKSFTGRNAPCVEIFHEKKRFAFQELKEVGMLVDVWADSYQGHNYLYIQSKHRHRYADGIYAYELDHTTFSFRYIGITFTKDALAQEQKEWQNSNTSK